MKFVSDGICYGGHVSNSGCCAARTCTFSAMRWSSQPVSMSLFLKLSVSSSLMRYSTVVRKSPRMDSSFMATTMFLLPIKSCVSVSVNSALLEQTEKGSLHKKMHVWMPLFLEQRPEGWPTDYVSEWVIIMHTNRGSGRSQAWGSSSNKKCS